MIFIGQSKKKKRFVISRVKMLDNMGLTV